MAKRMNVSLAYGSHLTCLMKAVEKTTGDILEMGTGVFSTPYLRYHCMLSGRKLVSYENHRGWYDFMLKYWSSNDNHEINFIDKYSNAEIERPWDVALIDQTPDSSRVKEIRRLVDCAKYIIIHDSNGRYNKIYHYDTIYPLFRYRTTWHKDGNHATVLSNLVDLENFWE